MARADRLRREQRALRDMLAYIVLAMRSAARLQSITILSLLSVFVLLLLLVGIVGALFNPPRR